MVRLVPKQFVTIQPVVVAVVVGVEAECDAGFKMAEHWEDLVAGLRSATFMTVCEVGCIACGPADSRTSSPEKEKHTDLLRLAGNVAFSSREAY